MHDIKFIKQNPKLFDNYLNDRKIKPASKKIIDLHEEYLEFLNNKQLLQEQKNNLSKTFSKKANIADLKEKVQTIKKKIEELNLLSEKKFKELQNILLNLPNIISCDTPIGLSEKDNRIIKEKGVKQKFEFKPKNHLELMENLKLIDYNQAIKISGSRFSILKGELAVLHRGLINFLIENNSLNHDYQECVVPELVKPSSLIGTGQLPKFEEDLFKTNFNDLYLIPTSEVPLTNLHRDSIINKKDLPLKYTTFSNCFRSEAGASGQDTKGLMREHQFGKVELVTISDPKMSKDELKKMLNCVGEILEKLCLPYRVVELCSGDLGFSSSYTVDFELWMPGQDKYREVSSCSNCLDFQARRMKMRVKDFDSGEIFFPHTLNGSSLAIGRLLVAIFENFQDKNGFIEIPKALQSYTSGLKKIRNND